MNALSLRVSSIRNGENLLKNSEIRVAVLALPSKHLAKPNECIDSDLARLKHEFSAATSIDQQLVTIRRCFTTISPDIGTEALSQVIQLITDVYFFAPLKHPVRNGIVKLLQKAQIFHGLITQCLVDTITEQTTNLVSLAGGADKRPPARELHATLLSLSGCFENFPIALTAVKMCLEPIYTAIGLALHSYWLDLTLPDQSPAQRSEVYIFVHTAVRLSLSVVQLCFAQTSIEPLAASLLPLNRQCLVLIEDRDVPMDTKVNCGQLLLLHAKLLDTVDEVFAEIVETARPADDDRMVRILVLCVGIVNTVNESHLEENNGCNVLRAVVEHLVAIATANAIEQNVLIAVARGLVQLSKVLMQFKLSTPLSDEERNAMQELSAAMLAFVWTFMEHYLDSVRHLSRDLLLNLLKLSHKHGRLFGRLIDECVTMAVANTAPAQVQCMAIDNLTQVLGARVVLERFPSVCEVLRRNLTEYNWMLCYDKLMVSNSKDQTLCEWFERWVRPILAYGASLQAREMIVSSAIKTRPEVVELIVATDEEQLPIETYLFVRWTVRQIGLKVLTDWQPAGDPILLAAKVHSTDAIRIMPLRILVDVNRTTETFSRAEMHEMLSFLYYNCNSQCPSMRMLIGVQMYNAFGRIELSHAVALRSASRDGQIVRDNIEFLQLLRDLCVGNLFAGANFSRRSTSLVILLSLVRTVQKMRTDGGEQDVSTRIWTHVLIDEMYKVLEADTYESNKVLAIDILKCCPTALNPVQRSPANMKETLQKLLCSVRPGESLAATYLVEYCCIFQWHFATPFEAIEWCEQLLIAGLRIAQQSLLEAARQNPLYGLVFCIKHLIDQLDLKQVDVIVWRPFLVRFIGTCKQLLAVVAPVVNSSSPEGHLPEEFGVAANSNGTTTTPQMLLLCAWRTVKEVSLLLGELTLQAPIVREPNATHGLIRIEDILQIGRTFQVMLTETKHRGAFEQAYVGFSKLCVRLWRSNEPELHSCPMRWLHALIDLIASNEPDAKVEAVDDIADLRYDRICATRRSAGVPFMIQALITAELQVCASSGLHYSMRRLIELCRSGAHEETRTHALNILRALFRCTDLGKSVAEYVADGLECSIRGYTARTWPERNSATLLFAALVTRIFGVQRTRHSDTLSIRNRMTGRIFFLRYPRLYDFMAAELRTATRMIADGERPPMLHPLLLLLSRLYPSALEGCESSLQLGAFLPDVLGCCVCAEMETRRLAVRSVVALVAPTAVMEHIGGVMEAMRATGATNSNAMHGYLLQIAVLIRSMTAAMAERERDQLTALWRRLLLVDMFGRPNYVLVRVYVDVLNEILLKMPALEEDTQDESSLNRLRKQIQQVFSDRRSAPVFLIGRGEAIKSCVLFNVLLAIKSRITAIENDRHCILYQHDDFMSQSIEYIDTVLNLMQLILNADCADPDADDEADHDEYAFTAMELCVHAAIKPDQIQAIATVLKNSVLLKENLLRVNKDPQFYPVQSTKALSVLSRLNVECPMSDGEMLELLASIDGKPDNVRNAVLKWVTANLGSATEEHVIGKLFRRLREATDPNASDKLRVTAAACLCSLPDPWQYAPYLLEFCDLALTMLRDDHYAVREHLARYVLKLCGQTTTVVPISMRAEELFLERLAVQTTDQEFWSQLLQRQLDDASTMDEDDSSDSAAADPSEVFNKNEANLFGEQHNTARLIYFKLRTFGDADCLEKYRSLADEVDYGFANPYVVERSRADEDCISNVSQ